MGGFPVAEIISRLNEKRGPEDAGARGGAKKCTAWSDSFCDGFWEHARFGDSFASRTAVAGKV
jgi:hypothetical protein